jgi:hypothetical protein
MPTSGAFSARQARSTSSGTSNYSTGLPTGTQTSSKQTQPRLPQQVTSTALIRRANLRTSAASSRQFSGVALPRSRRYGLKVGPGLTAQRRGVGLVTTSPPATASPARACTSVRTSFRALSSSAGLSPVLGGWMSSDGPPRTRTPTRRRAIPRPPKAMAGLFGAGFPKAVRGVSGSGVH